MTRPVWAVQYNLRKLERMGELKTLVGAGPKGCNLYQVMPNLPHYEPEAPRCNPADEYHARRCNHPSRRTY